MLFEKMHDALLSLCWGLPIGGNDFSSMSDVLWILAFFSSRTESPFAFSDVVQEFDQQLCVKEKSL